MLALVSVEGALAAPGASLDMVPGKKSDTFELARAAAKAAERQQKLAQEEAEARGGPGVPGDYAKETKAGETKSGVTKKGDAMSSDAKGSNAEGSDPKAAVSKVGAVEPAGAERRVDGKKAGSNPKAVEAMSDGTMRIRPSADPRKAIDAIRERLSSRGVEPRVDAEGNALLRVGSAEVKPVNSNRLLTSSATMTSRSTRKSIPGDAGVEHGKGMTADAHRTVAKPNAVTHGTPHWSYDGENSPEQWAHLSPEWATCAKGKRQSPIDIHEGIKVDLESIRFEYRPSAFTVVDNGHTIQVNLPPGNAITVAGHRYELVQFHFHKPAEERVDGKPFDMVVHLVHKDASGKLAVVAVLLEKGSAQEAVQSVWNHLPLEKGDEVEAGVPLDPTALLPAEHGYYTYMGSLTTPPCSEGVLWMVMKQPVGVSADQLAIFARLYPMNARPLQADSSRLIKESN